MIYTIRNSYLTVNISDVGAELAGICSNKKGVQYLWQGNPNLWGGRAPLLFPLIGQLKDGKCSIGGQTFDIPTHGFVSILVFNRVETKNDEICFRLESSAATEKNYPFKFTLEVAYRLIENRLIKTYKISNNTNKEMPFELGGHEGYNIALFPGETMKDYYITFHGGHELATRLFDKNGLLEKNSKPVNLEEEKLYLAPDVFRNGALIFDRKNCGDLSLANTKNGLRIDFDFNDFSYMGLWTIGVPENANFICVEPWTTLPDGNYLGTEFEKKEGIQILKGNTTKTLSYSMTFREE